MPDDYAQTAQTISPDVVTGLTEPAITDVMYEEIQKIMEEIAQEFEAIKDNYTVEWSEDYSSVTFNVDDEGLFSDNTAEALENMGHTFWINYILQTIVL